MEAAVLSFLLFQFLAYGPVCVLVNLPVMDHSFSCVVFIMRWTYIATVMRIKTYLLIMSS
jgi:hypothetical protein